MYPCIFKKLRDSLTLKAKIMLFNSLILSRINYCCVIYPSNSSNINRLEKLYYRISKTLFRESELLSLNKKRLLGLNNIYEYNACLIIKKYTQNKPENYHSHKYSTRNQNSFNLSFFNRSYCSSVIFKHKIIFNSIPSDIKNI